MIKILDNTKSLDLLVNDNTNGLGKFEANTCLVSEELNGIYECDITMLATDKHFKDLSVGGLLEIPVSETDTQIFRIYYISKPINELVEIKTQHITYDLNKVPVKPFNATGAANAKNGMLNNIMGTYPFTMTTNIANTTSKFVLDIPRSFRECLGGYEGSLLDTFKCEYQWDNLEVKMLSKRGTDNNVRISYGKNLTDFKQEENIENVYTSVLGYAVINDITYTGEVYHKIQATYPKVLIVDFSDQYEQDTTPTTADLTTKAQEYATNNDIEVPNVNLSISFVPLWQTEEYKNVAPLERVFLGDTVHVFFEKLGVEASARVIKTVWDANLMKYESMELGNAKANLNTVLNEIKKETLESVNVDTSFFEQELNDMAKLIINGLGLHITKADDGQGGTIYYLHNKSTLADSDTQYIFTSAGFLVSTDYGRTWNAGFDSEGNAVVNSLSTIVLKALEIYGSTINGTIINGGTINFGDINGVHISAHTNTSNNGVIFDGTGTIEFEPKISYTLQVVNSDDTNYYTRITANSQSLYLSQNDPNNNYELANKMSLSTNAGNYRAVDIGNFKIGHNNTLIPSNEISLVADKSGTYLKQQIELKNYWESNGNLSNRLTLNSGASSSYVSMANFDTNGNNVNNIILESVGSTTRIQIANSISTLNQITLSDKSSGQQISLANNGGSIDINNLTNNKNIEIYCSGSIYLQNNKIGFSTIGGRNYVTWS